MAAIEIVPIGEEHIGSFHRTLDSVARERKYLAFLEAPPIESTRAYILDCIKNGYPQWAALSEGEVVGWCDVQRKQRPVHAHVGILGMGLLPAFRRQGIGARLIQQTLVASKQFGFRRVELTVRYDNANAIALYKRVGFEIEGRQRNAVEVDGAFEDLILMAVLF